jgi:hypothetical protein
MVNDPTGRRLASRSGRRLRSVVARLTCHSRWTGSGAHRQGNDHQPDLVAEPGRVGLCAQRYRYRGVQDQPIHRPAPCHQQRPQTAGDRGQQQVVDRGTVAVGDSFDLGQLCPDHGQPPAATHRPAQHRTPPVAAAPGRQLCGPSKGAGLGGQLAGMTQPGQRRCQGGAAPG